jgi:aminoglycoside phosphotransferase (APT) family kinase protein
MREWTAEVMVDETQARRLITGQFPEVPAASMRVLGEGWDNTAWFVDERWVFRFPRRAVAIPGFERELAALPRLAPLLPLPVPDPVFQGRPTEDFPWPWFGAPHVPGVEPLGLGETARAGLARPLGEFLRVLHRAEIDADLPADPMGRAHMAVRVAKAEEQLAEVEAAGLWRVPRSVARLLDMAADLPFPEPSAVVHGDLHMRHLLVDERAALTGVIDFGDICRGAPAVDLSLLWSLIPAHARGEFLAAYGPLAEDQLIRARVLALSLNAALALYGNHEGMRDVEYEALAGLDRTAAG